VVLSFVAGGEDFLVIGDEDDEFKVLLIIPAPFLPILPFLFGTRPIGKAEGLLCELRGILIKSGELLLLNCLPAGEGKGEGFVYEGHF
jgi:hypothetical protein